MTHTIIGLFDSQSEAQAAMSDLVAAGFAKENIDFSNRRYDDGASTSTATTSGAGTGGGIGGFFNSLFGDDTDEARRYSDVATDTEAILTVQTDSDERARQIADILDRNGAVDVDERSNQYQATYAQSGGTTSNQTTEGDMTIPIIEEELQVGKRTVEQGGVRVRSRIIEKPVEETVRLREEHVVVNRRPVNREVTEGDMTNFREGDFEITERSEEAVVGKQSRVVEEVQVGKTVSEREQVVSDTVRRTDVEVEEIEGDVTTRKANS